MPQFDAIPLADHGSAPVLVTLQGDSPGALPRFAKAHRQVLDDLLLEHGALLFRGFEVGSAAEFALFGRVMAPSRVEYLYRSTPRTAVSDGVVTATEYPADQTIPLHCENAYQRSWPLKIAFWCRHAADQGGQTPIARMLDVTERIGPDLLHRFAERGVRYVRHYRPGLDLPWQTVFQTEDRDQAARYCSAHGIDLEWLADGVLRTSQACHGVATHPVRGETVIFNQAHLFHLSSLDPQIAQQLRRDYRDAVPRDAAFGDGGPIDEDALASVRRAYADNAFEFDWRNGDVLLLDNMQFAHGRRPFSGRRELLAQLLEPYAP